MSEARSTILRRDEQGIIRNGAEWLAIWSDPAAQSPTVRRADQSEVEALAAVREGLAGSLRSLARQPGLAVCFGEGGDGAEGTMVRVAGPKPDLSDLAAARGECDKLAARLRYEDPTLQDAARPEDERAARLIALCHLLRAEALLAEAYPGTWNNMLAYETARLAAAQLLHAPLASLIPLTEGLAMTVRDALAARREPSFAAPGFRIWHRYLHHQFGDHLAALVRLRHDAPRYTSAVRSFVAELIDDFPLMGEALRKLRCDEDGATEDRPAATGAQPFDAAGLDLGDVERPVRLTPPATEVQRYRRYTTRHDRIVHAGDLCDRDTLRQMRDRVLARHPDLSRHLARLAAALSRRLQARVCHDWAFNQEEGLIDAARLDRLVSEPSVTDVFKVETTGMAKESVVALLIDNSGSMRGKAIEIVLMAAELMTSALERAGIACEILGYTTRSWKGGQSAVDWRAAGSPPNPGRLNDLLHIVYKSAGERMHQVRQNLYAGLLPNLLKENIDGEALIWAGERLRRRREPRKILIVLSDGAPADVGTGEANEGGELLEAHLTAAITQLSVQQGIEIVALGIGYDVDRFYARSTRLESADTLGESLLNELDRLL
jgi:cobaltochelatase CobT